MGHAWVAIHWTLKEQEALHGGTNFFGQIYGGMFYMETNDQMVQGGGNVSQMHFPVICKSEHCKSENFPWPWWGAH